MEKKLIKSDKDLKNAKSFFGQVQNWDKEINEATAGKKMPFLLIASFSEDVDFGSLYQFISVDVNDLEA